MDHFVSKITVDLVLKSFTRGSKLEHFRKLNQIKIQILVFEIRFEFKYIFFEKKKNFRNFFLVRNLIIINNNNNNRY